jgi:hypothetical protein
VHEYDATGVSSRSVRRVRVKLALMLVVTGCDKLLGLSPVEKTPDALVAPADGTPGLYVQQKIGAGNGTTLTVTLDHAPTNGNVLVIVGADTSNVLTGVTGGGATWQHAVQRPGSQNIEIWYGRTDGSSSTVTTSTSASGETWMSLSEWSGLSTTSLYEASHAASGTGGLANAGALSTVDAPVLLIFGVAARTAIGTNIMDVAPGTWTALDSIEAGTITQSEWYRVATMPGPFLPQTMVTSTWDSGIAAFRVGP